MEKREYRRYIKEKKFMKRLKRQARTKSGYGYTSFDLQWFLQTNMPYLQKLKTTSGYAKYHNWYTNKNERKIRRNTEKMQYYKNLIDEIEHDTIPFRVF